jgi:hypothetical protein
VDSPPLEPSTPAQRRAFLVLSASPMLFWVPMIVAPRSALTARLARLVPGYLLALGTTYVALVAVTAVHDGRPPNVVDLDGVRRLLSRPTPMLAGWAHYLAFDLFVGRWVWATARREGRSARLATTLTLLAGPAGLTLFQLQRRLRPAGA